MVLPWQKRPKTELDDRIIDILKKIAKWIIWFIGLYGNAFAQPYRNLVKRQEKGDLTQMGIEMVAGHCVSIILMVLFLASIQWGGIWAVAGSVGFSINLITAVNSLMPIGQWMAVRSGSGTAVFIWGYLSR